MADNGRRFHTWLQGTLSIDNAPAHVERASYIDSSGYRNDVYICYWTDPNSCQAWFNSSEFSDWWQNKARLTEDSAYWREVIFIPRDRLETSFSSKDAAGMTTMAPQFTDESKQHGYWGAMRDRIKKSETDDFESPYGRTLIALQAVESRGKRLRLTPPENICLIRSAQNWTSCKGEELLIYQNDVQPFLTEGMNYIRDNPIETGCISCRFMDELTMTGGKQARTFGMAWFLTIGHLEAWASSHPSHLAIFQSFHKMVKKLDFEVELKLWHEVIVLPIDNHIFEYVNCHPQTGLLPYFIEN